jgi:flagellar FliJ protein
MKRSKRLDPVARVEKSRERTAARELGQQQQQLNELRTRLQELIDYRTEYQQKYMQAINNSMGSTAIQEYRCFLSKLDRAIEQQYQLIAGGEQKVSDSRQHWMQKRTRLKAIDTLVEKIQAQERCQDNRREQQESDERALFARRLTHLKSF